MTLSTEDQMLTIPWDALHPDNDKYIIARHSRRLILAPAYRAAKTRLRDYAQASWSGPVITEPVEIRVALYFPRIRRHGARKRDITNYIKIICDGLKGIVFADDSQVRRCLIEYGGRVDDDDARAEIEIKEIEWIWPDPGLSK